MESFIDFNKVKDFFYSVPNINEATTDDDIPTPRLIYAALAKQTLEGPDMCSRMTEKLLAKLVNTSAPPISAAVIYKTLLTIQYLLQYGHPDFYRALQDRYDPILVLMDWRGNSPADETPAMLIQEKASVLVEMLRSAHPVPLPSADTSSENTNVAKGWTFTWPTLPSLPNFSSSPANTAQANSNLTSSGISSSVVSNAPWTLGSIWSIFSSNGQSSTITSTTTTTSNNNNEPDRLSRYRPVQITPLPSSPSELSFGPAKTNGFNPTWKPKTVINNNTNNTNNYNQHSNNNHSPASEVGNNNGDISGLFPTVYNNNHNNSKESPKDKFNPKPEPIVSGPDPTSIFQLYYKKEYNAVENICQVLPTSLSRPSQSQIMEFLEIVKNLELGPVVFLLLQNLSNPDWLRKFRALIIIRELIAHNFPKVRDYFNEEGKSTLLSLSEDPHAQIKEQVSQLLKELSQPTSNPLPPRTEPQQTQLFPIISQESDHSQPNEVSLFASLEITKPNDHHHHHNDPLINSLTPQGQISETSLFDFIREDVNSEKKPNPHVLANPMEDPFISSIPPEKNNSNNTVVKPSPSLAVQEPIISKPTPSSNLPASVFSALSQLPDATPNNSSPSDTLPAAHTKSLFTDMAAAAAANNTAKTTTTTTTTSAFQTQPPYTLPNQLPNTATPYPMYPYPYTNPYYYPPPPMYPYPYTNPVNPVMPNPIPLNGQPSLFTNL